MEIRSRTVIGPAHASGDNIFLIRCRTFLPFLQGHATSKIITYPCLANSSVQVAWDLAGLRQGRPVRQFFTPARGIDCDTSGRIFCLLRRQTGWDGAIEAGHSGVYCKMRPQNRQARTAQLGPSDRPIRPQKPALSRESAAGRHRKTGLSFSGGIHMELKFHAFVNR